MDTGCCKLISYSLHRPEPKCYLAKCTKNLSDQSTAMSRLDYTMRTKCAISYVSSDIAFLRFCVFADPRLRKNAMTQQLFFYVGRQRTEFDGSLRVKA